jgi:hypothetical protein
MYGKETLVILAMGVFHKGLQTLCTGRNRFELGVQKSQQSVPSLQLPCGLADIHSCWYIQEIIPDLLDAGVDLLNLGQPNLNDIERLGEEFGEKVRFVCT